MFAILQAAGWPIWFLLATSIIAVALIIERSISLRTAKIIPPRLFDQVVDVYRRQGVSEEVLERLARDSPLGAVLAAGLRNHKSSRYVMKEAIEEAGRAVAHDLERFLTTLGTIATEVAKSPIERTALIIVGKVLGARDFRNSALYDAAYQRRFRGRGP